MCGIVGYIGNRPVVPVLLDGLKRLEYRGYDSAGVAVLNEKTHSVKAVSIAKSVGKLAVLAERLEKQPVEGTQGIGHTRWATHGRPSDENSHPHTDCTGKVVVVHNGIIENFASLKKGLLERGHQFSSETDTEVIAHLLEEAYHGSLKEAVLQVLKTIRGSFALGIMHADEPGTIVAVRKDSPLIVGIGQGENFLASDIPAILPYTRDIYLMDDMDVAVITKDQIQFFRPDGTAVRKEIFHVEWDAVAAEKGGYEHFMLKEIHEEPRALRDTLIGRVDPESGEVILDSVSLTKEELANYHKIFVVACGTAYHAGMVGKYAIEKLARIPVEVDLASEFRYRDPMVNEHTLTIVVSQSGETADTLAALRECKKRGSRVIAITNVVGSSVAREADEVIFTWAGPEIAVASTKAYITQLLVFYLLALKLAQLNGTISLDKSKELVQALLKIPAQAEEVLGTESEIKDMAYRLAKHCDAFYIGRGVDYAVSLEGALKLKEISYIHAEAYAAGELKHGPLALIDKDIPVFALATQSHLLEKMLSNIKEVKAREAYVFGIAPQGETEIAHSVDRVLYIPKTHPLFMPVLTVIPLQLLSYYAAIARGTDVDKPRNLAKSVTVE